MSTSTERETDMIEERNENYTAHKASSRDLYSWNWIGGGYNQVYADNEQEAIEHAKGMCKLEPDMSTFKVHTDESAQHYWDTFPTVD